MRASMRASMRVCAGTLAAACWARWCTPLPCSQFADGILELTAAGGGQLFDMVRCAVTPWFSLYAVLARMRMQR